MGLRPPHTLFVAGRLLERKRSRSIGPVGEGERVEVFIVRDREDPGVWLVDGRSAGDPQSSGDCRVASLRPEVLPPEDGSVRCVEGVDGVGRGCGDHDVAGPGRPRSPV